MSSANAPLASLVALTLAGCTAEPTPGEPVVSRTTHVQHNLSYGAKLDMLFVVDSSAALTSLRAHLAEGYRGIVGDLPTPWLHELPDLHIGVITADFADSGRLRGGAFLQDTPLFDTTRARNYTGALGDALVNLADVGSTGSGIAPLAALERALAPGVNPGFVRDDAYLQIVIITGADDQGSSLVANVAAAVRASKSDPSRILVTAATGPCDGAAGAPRIAAFLGEFPNRSSHASVCGDLRETITLTHQLFKWTLEEPTFGAPLADTRPDLPGLQPECTAWLLDPTSDQARILPQCSDQWTNGCWAVGSENEPWGPTVIYTPRKYPFPVISDIECLAE